ncbi:MAG: prolipoprotein diacylglyceryl transferase [Candidatus Zixiibacteriota bacterium]
MCPEFFHIGPLAIRAYGVTLSLSFFIGLFLVHREARVLRLDPERAVNFAFILIIFGVIGARLGYVAYHWSEFAHDLLAIINPFNSGVYFGIAGLNLQGGFVFAFVAGCIYLWRKKLPWRASLDAVVPAVAFGIFLTRIGCFLNGCCFGTPTDSFLGVQFPSDSPPWYVFGDAHLHPTQLYSSGYGLLLMALLMWLNRRPHGDGLTVGVFFMVEAVFRFAIEFVRYYEPAMWMESAGLHVTFNQIVAATLFALGIALVVLSRRSPRSIRRPEITLTSV